MPEHTKVYDVYVGDTAYQVSCSAKVKMLADLGNFRIPYTRVVRYQKPVDRVGSSLFLNNTLRRALTVPELARELLGQGCEF